MTPKQRSQRQVDRYGELIAITEQVVGNARRVLARTAKVSGIAQKPAIPALRKEIEHHCQLGDRVIDQSRCPVLQGEQVSAEQKVYSIFELHTDLIKRRKVDKPVEFGHKVFLAESACGLITQYRVLEGNPIDENHVEPSLQRHKKTFGHTPELYGTDRGFYSEKNVRACEQAGVLVASIPQRGGKRLPSVKLTKGVLRSGKDSVSVPASKAVSRFSSAAVA